MNLPALSRLNAPPLPSALPPLALSLAPPAAAQVAAQTAALPLPPAGSPLPSLSATVVASVPVPPAEGGGVQLTLQLPNGTQVPARSPTPVAVGSTLQLPPAPRALTPSAAPPPPTVLPNGTSPLPEAAPTILRALILPPSVPTVAIPTPSLTTLVATPTLLPQLTLVSASPLPEPLVLYPPQSAIPGPLPLKIPANLPANMANTPLTLTLQTPTQGTLQPSTTATPNAPRPPAVMVQLPTPLNLPLRTAIPIIIPDTQGLSTQAPSPKAYAQESIQVTAQIITNSTPSPAAPSTTPTGRPSLPTTTLQSALRLLVPPEAPSGPQLVRVLPQPAQSPTGLQPVVLATGQAAQLEVITPNDTASPKAPIALSAPLAAGTVLRVNIPTLGGPVQILQLHSHQPQLQPQPQAQGAQPTAPQTPQAVLAVGSVVSGVIQGQDALGQPILTLRTPAALANQSFTLSLGNAPGTPAAPLAATLVVGSKVQISVQANGAAQLLSLELPPATARATTLANLGSQWATLQQTLAQLQHAAPSLAAQARQNLPSLAAFLPGLMRLLEGIKTQDPAKLLGTEAARLAASLGPDLAPDLAQLQQLLAKPPEDPTQWRGFIFPYFENPDGQPQQGSFFFRREAEDDPRGSASTRFVAELNLSALGPVQLDGLVTYPEIWLKLRLQQTQPEGFGEGLHALLSDLLTRLNLQGGISVETVSQFPISPASQLRAAADDAVGVAA